MDNRATRKWARVLAAIVFGALFGVAMGFALRGLMNPTATLEELETPPGALQPTPEATTTAIVGDAPVTTTNSVAMRYALALQNGEFAHAVTMTRWMQERLDYLHRESGTQAAVERGQEALVEQLSDRSVERNRFTEEGIEDQYIFAPGVHLEPLGVDEGLADLDAPTASRTWIRARFLSQQTAPRDAQDVPIRSVIVGVNVSSTGEILKANVIGNLELDMESVVYDWTSG